MRRSIMAITAAAFITAALVLSVPLRAQIATIDASNLAQNTTTALKAVQSYAQQVQQYQTQLNQYRLQAMNATGLTQAAQIYQQYTRTMQQLQSIYGQFANGGNLQNYLNQFQSVGYWAQVPPGNYAQTAAASWNQNSQTQKNYDDNWAQALVQHQQLLQQNAQSLTQAQNNVNSAAGQMQAIQASAQINAAIAKELLEIHALLVQEQQALQARQASQANQDAMAKAYNDQLTGAGTTYTAQDGKVWIP